MRFHGKITVNRFISRWDRDTTTDIYDDYFEAKSIQSAKAYLTKLANTTELFSWIQSWDNKKRTYTGKDVRWEPTWSGIRIGMTEKGQEIACTDRLSERESGESVNTESYNRYGTSAQYRVDLTLRWLHESISNQ